MPNKLHEYNLKAPEHAKEIMDVTNQSTSMGAAMCSESKIYSQPDNVRSASHKKEYLLIEENKKSAKESTKKDTALTAKSQIKNSELNNKESRVSPTIYVKEKKTIFGSRKSEYRERGLLK